MNAHKWFLMAGMLVILCVLLLSAWLCDDAYISFRTAENAANGLGLRWNPIERVQSFTHPLWLLILVVVRFVTGDLYYSTLFLSIILCLLTTWAILRNVARGLIGPVLVLWAMVFSRAFIDFSTSGLEGPLAHLLMTILFLRLSSTQDQDVLTNNQTTAIFLLLSGLLLCRLDYFLLLGPLVFVSLRKRPPLRSVIMGLAPLAVWEAFSLLYYGSLFPNSAYAKLGGGLGLAPRITAGLTYLKVSVFHDPVTGLVIATGILVGIFYRKRRLLLASAIGIVLYLGYTMAIGGDFMAGRFLAAPFVLSLLLVTRIPLTRVKGATVLGLLVLASLAGGDFTQTLSPRFGNDQWPYLGGTGVADERMFYYPHTGLMRRPSGIQPNTHPWVFDGIALRESGQTPITRTTVGFYGYFAGPDITIIDLFGLCDPLLARLASPQTTDWRIGHLERNVPAGYLETVATDRGMTGDTDIARLENRLRLAARGPLFSRERWKAIGWLVVHHGGTISIPDTAERP